MNNIHKTALIGTGYWGSIIANTLLVVGAAALFRPVGCQPLIARYEMPFLLGCLVFWTFRHHLWPHWCCEKSSQRCRSYRRNDWIRPWLHCTRTVCHSNRSLLTMTRCKFITNLWNAFWPKSHTCKFISIRITISVYLIYKATFIHF